MLPKVKLNAKAVPLHATKELGGVEVQLLLIHDLGIRWGEWSASSTVRTYPRGKDPPVENE
jgi:hypothetical protein